MKLAEALAETYSSSHLKLNSFHIKWLQIGLHINIWGQCMSSIICGIISRHDLIAIDDKTENSAFIEMNS